MKQNFWVRIAFFFLGIIIIGLLLTLGNIHTHRINTSPDTVIEISDLGDQLYLLFPEWQISQAGDQTVYKAKIRISTSNTYSGIYFPRSKDGSLLINNSSAHVIEENDQFIYLFEPMQNAQTISIELRLPSTTYEMYSVAQLYIGNYNTILFAGFRESNLRLFIIGLSFTIILFSASLYIQKPTEKYLLPLTMLAFSTFGYVTLKAFPTLLDKLWVSALLLGPYKLPFLSLQTSILLYNVGFPLLVAFLNYLLIKNFISVKIFKIEYFYIVAAAAVLTFVSIKLWHLSLLVLTFRIFINILECIVILKGTYKYLNDAIILVTGAVGTVALNLFIAGCGLNIIPNGNADLLFRLGGLSSSIYPIAFTIAINGIFARKYAESEILSEELNNLNQNLQIIVNERTSELKTAYQQLEQEQKQKDIFTTNMVHSLKTPLFSIAGFADMAQEALKSAPEQMSKYLDLINSNVDYVVKLVNNLFLAIRLEQDQVNYMMEKMNLNKMMDHIYNTTLTQTQQKGISLHLQTPETIQQIECDLHYLTLAIQNIADNAVRHTPSGGEIWLSLTDLGEEVQISIKDNGEGMDEAVAKHIFERYYSHSSQGNSSSGLGLAISKDVIKALDGQISVTSIQKEGTQFIIILPKTISSTINALTEP